MSLLVMTGCSTLKVYSDADTQADFNLYKTYDWSPPPKEVKSESPLQNPLTDQRIKNAIQSELTIKGISPLKENEKPDFIISYHAATRERFDVGNTGLTYGYAPWSSYYSPWIGGYYSSAPNVYEYVEGTLIVDFIDAKSNHLFWRGIAVKVLDQPVVNEETVKTIIHKIFENYPPKTKPN